MLILLQRPFYRICRPPEAKEIPDSVGLQGQQAGGCTELFGFLSLRRVGEVHLVDDNTNQRHQEEGA